MKIFWSWQSDFEPDECRHFIRSSLVDSIAAVSTELALDDSERPEIDHDTKDTPGMAEITKTILDKISNAAVFVADVTPIGKSDSKTKALPNPNVLIELGWALSKLGPDRIIAVLNTASGYKPEDLPFDIRHRRTLTYALANTANKPTREKARRDLARDLTGALKSNLGKHLEDKASSEDLTGVPANASNRSIWATATDPLQHSDSFGHSHLRAISFPSCPRGYIRIIPAGWKNGPPSVSDIGRLETSKVVWPQPEGTREGDSGACEEGFVRYWITSKDAQEKRETRNVVMYFDTTGEFWVLHGTALSEGKLGTLLRIDSLLQGWYKAMTSALALFDELGANPTRKIETGVVGIKGARWPAPFSFESPPARKGDCLLTRQLRKWDEDARLLYLTDAYNRVRDLFGLTMVHGEDLRKMITG